MNPTQIISSDLGRAVETAQALADLTGLGFSSHESLRETNGGLWEGKTGSQNRAEDFHNFIRWIDGDFEVSNIVTIDLAQRTVPTEIIGAAPHQPVCGRG